MLSLIPSTFGLIRVAVLFATGFFSGCGPGNAKTETLTVPPPIQDKATSKEPQRNAIRWSFQDVAQRVGINFTYHNGQETGHASVLETLGGGVAWLDADLDGQLDLFIPGGGSISTNRQISGHRAALYRQMTDARFEDVSHAANVDQDSPYSHGVTVGDHDSDGFPDVLVTGYGRLLFLHNQGDGTFREQAQQSGLIDDRWSTSAAWGDINGDGDLDLYITHYVKWNWETHHYCRGPAPNVPEVCSPKEFDALADFVFLSRGDGTFREASAEVGLRPDGKGLGVVMGDVDLDGDLDIYVCNDTTENFLYLNDGQGHLQEVGSRSGVDVDDHGVMNGSMGVDLGDYDGDGQPDIWVTNYYHESFAMYRHVEQTQFQHRSETLGIAALSGLNVGWGTGFADLDRDGHEDLIATTGHVLFHTPPDRQIPIVLRNESGRRFSRVELSPTTYMGQPHHGRGLALADYDNDGDLDFAISHNNEPVSLVRNDVESTGSWLQVRLIGRRSNRDAIGSRLLLQSDRRPQLRLIKGGGSYLSHSDRHAFWGIPAEEKLSQLRIHWPSGIQQEVDISKRNQTLTVIEPR